MNKLRTVLLVTAASVLLPTLASAQEVGALQVLIGSKIDATMRKSIGNALARAGNAGPFQFVSEADMRRKLPQAVRDCFTPTCLKQAGEATGSAGGIRIRFNGEAEIYDWNVDIYDLRTGRSTSSEAGSCELCGSAEVERDFEITVRAALDKSKFSSAPSQPVATKPAPKPDTKPKPEPKPDPEPTSVVDNADEPPSDDPMAGLVMVEIAATPDDTIITMGDQQIGVGTSAISVEPGTYEIMFTREGYGALRETVTIAPNSADKAFLRVHLSKTDPDAVYVAQEGPMDRLGDKKITYGLVGLGTGGLLLATGAWLNAIDGNPTCGGDVTTCERVRETSAAAFITTLAGGVLATGGVAFLVWDVLAGKNEKAPSTARVYPVVGDKSAGVGFTTRF